MGDFLRTDVGHAVQLTLMLFYWVPFAIGAWFADHDGAERTRIWLRSSRDRIRHIGPHRPITHQPA